MPYKSIGGGKIRCGGAAGSQPVERVRDVRQELWPGADLAADSALDFRDGLDFGFAMDGCLQVRCS